MQSRQIWGLKSYWQNGWPPLQRASFKICISPPIDLSHKIVTYYLIRKCFGAWHAMCDVDGGAWDNSGNEWRMSKSWSHMVVWHSMYENGWMSAWDLLRKYQTFLQTMAANIEIRHSSLQFWLTLTIMHMCVLCFICIYRFTHYLCLCMHANTWYF